MFNKRGIIAKQSKDSSFGTGLHRGLFCGKLFMRAFADEGGSEGSNGGNGGSEGNNYPINFETLIANARKEEKEKLYPRMKKLEDENKVLVQTNNDNLMKLAQAQNEIDTLKANNGESQKVKDLEAQLEKANNEIKSLKESTPNEEEIRKKVEEEYEVKYYRNTKLSNPENADKILSVFADEVTGNTKEEIDASFERAVQKTIQTKKQLGLVDEEGNPIKSPNPDKKKKETPNTKPNTPPVANPGDDGDEKFDMDYVQNLDPRSPEYAEFRKKMGLR